MDKKVGVIKPPVFLPPSEQLQEFLAYNEWLKKTYSGVAISEAEIEKMKRKIGDLSPDVLIFYCHKGNVVLTAKLAWEYICSYRRKKVRKPDFIEFEPAYLNLADSEKPRPNGFYAMKRPPEDREAIGRKFKGLSVSVVRQQLDNDWGMASEGLQFVGITHKHYPELMNGNEFPFIDLPGFVATLAVGVSYFAPYLLFRDGVLRFDFCNIGFAMPPDYGSGSLQQC